MQIANETETLHFSWWRFKNMPGEAFTDVLTKDSLPYVSVPPSGVSHGKQDARRKAGDGW
jgi:hypothetical protein